MSPKPAASTPNKALALRQIDPSAALAGKDYGHKITSVRDQAGKALKYTINQTMMRVDLPQAVAPGKTVTFSIDWNFKIIDAKNVGGRSGYEFFPKDGNYVYEIAQWFPRMARTTTSTAGSTSSSWVRANSR